MDKLEKVLDAENNLKDVFKKYEEISFLNSKKVLDSFKKENIVESDFNSTTGYGYNDIGRDKIEAVYADIFKAESALVRSQFISGSHALNVVFFALLRPNDTLLSISGTPYDTLHEVIGIKENKSSLKSFGINYEEINLIDNDFDYNKIKDTLSSKKIKVIEIQRSKGYSTRKSITIEKLEKVIKFIRSIDKDVIIMIDNCYCEFVSTKEPIEVGADIAVGSLIKNLGGGIAPNGAYVVGREDLIDLVGERLTLPGEGRDVGPTLGINKSILQGLFLAPSVVLSALKTSALLSYLMEQEGYEVEPKYNENRADIVLSITLGNEDKLTSFCNAVQSSSPIDSNAKVVGVTTPGYDDKVVMASGSFTQGSSIEISADGPIREPYIAFFQGSLTYEYGRIACINILKSISK